MEARRLNWYMRRLRIWETNFGRDAGWIAERHGQPIAILTESHFEDMFWDSYRIEVVTDDHELRKAMQTESFWVQADGLRWRNRELGEYAEALVAGTPFPKPNRLMIRGLYLPISRPWPWDMLILWWRRQQRK